MPERASKSQALADPVGVAWFLPGSTPGRVRYVNEVQRDEEVAQAVLRYLAEHPEAMDTLDGIAEWWLMRQQVRVSVTTLARVLRRLTESGVLEETGTGQSRRYRLKR